MLQNFYRLPALIVVLYILVFVYYGFYEITFFYDMYIFKMWKTKENRKVPHKAYNNSKTSAKKETITNEPNNHNMSYTRKSNGIDVQATSKYFRKEI